MKKKGSSSLELYRIVVGVIVLLRIILPLFQLSPRALVPTTKPRWSWFARRCCCHCSYHKYSGSVWTKRGCTSDPPRCRWWVLVLLVVRTTVVPRCWGSVNSARPSHPFPSSESRERIGSNQCVWRNARCILPPLTNVLRQFIASKANHDEKII